MATLRERIGRALAQYDETMALCPVNNPKRGRVIGFYDRCPRCSAKASESCGLDAGAGNRLATAVREAMAMTTTHEDFHIAERQPAPGASA